MKTTTKDSDGKTITLNIVVRCIEKKKKKFPTQVSKLAKFQVGELVNHYLPSHEGPLLIFDKELKNSNWYYRTKLFKTGREYGTFDEASLSKIDSDSDEE